MSQLTINAACASGLTCVCNQNDETISAWCHMATDALRTGVNPRIISSAAGRLLFVVCFINFIHSAKLDMSIVEVRRATEALMTIFTDAARLNVEINII